MIDNNIRAYRWVHPYHQCTSANLVLLNRFFEGREIWGNFGNYFYDKNLLGKEHRGVEI